MSASIKIPSDDESIKGVIVLDIGVGATLAFLLVTAGASMLTLNFIIMYTLIVLELFAIAFVLLYAALFKCLKVVHSLIDSHQMMAMLLVQLFT